MRAAVYIPNHNGSQRIGRALRSLREQSRPLDVVVVDNGSDDDSLPLLREEFPEVTVLGLERNLGFGPAINRAVREHPADPLILLNNDVECEPRFVEAMLDAAEGVQSVAGVLLQERAPWLIDSAGVVADSTLMGFDYLHGEPAEAVVGAAAPLGPTGGAALYDRTAFEAVGGFDERISASLGAGSGQKFAHTGWSRGYMLRRYGVMSHPRLALRALACEGTICVGQLLWDHTAKGVGGRLRGWREGGGLGRRDVGGAPLLPISAREALALRRRRRAD